MPGKIGKSTIRISAVVCTYNRYESLPKALGALRKQSLPPSEYEIVVVDNSSDTAAQGAFWKAPRRRASVKVEIQAEPGLSKARNAGFRAASGALVAYCDDDAVVSPKWLESLVRLFDEEPEAGVGGGPVVPIWPAARPEWLHDWSSGFFTILDRGAVRRRLDDEEWLAGTNIAFRRELLLESGGFDESLGRRGNRLLSNEELEITRRIRALGFGAFYEPAAVVEHHVHQDRISQSWLRRRVAWQAISDAVAPDAEAQSEHRRWWDAIADYALRVPPEMRSFRGLFLDTEDADTMHRQCEAISALMRLMIWDGEDPERLAGK